MRKGSDDSASASASASVSVSASASNPITQKAERPPLLKKSKTSISGDTHFPGPLFPAVRRISPTPPSPPLRAQLPDLRVSVGNDDASPAHSISNSSGIVDNSFSGRDWIYPSFLGPHVAGNRVTVKGRRGSGSDSSSSSNTNKVDEQKKGIGGVSSNSVGVKEEKLKAEKEANDPAPASKVLVTQTSSLTQSGVRSNSGLLKHSLVFYFVCLSVLIPVFFF